MRFEDAGVLHRADYWKFLRERQSNGIPMISPQRGCASGCAAPIVLGQGGALLCAKFRPRNFS